MQAKEQLQARLGAMASRAATTRRPKPGTTAAMCGLLCLALGGASGGALGAAAFDVAVGLTPFGPGGSTRTNSAGLSPFPGTGTALFGYLYDTTVDNFLTEAKAYSRYSSFSLANPKVDLQLGVFAQLHSGIVGLTTTGLPHDPLHPDVNPLIDHPVFGSVSASATYRDQVTFLDPSRPIGTPLTITLSYYMDGPCHMPICHVPGPATAALPEFVNPLLTTTLFSEVEGPGGPDAEFATKSMRGTYRAAATALSVGIPLTHTFSVDNGIAVWYQVDASANITMDTSQIDLFEHAKDFGYFRTFGKIDHFGTMTLSNIEGSDAAGTALNDLRMLNSAGWEFVTTPAPVPEPATWLFMLTGLAVSAAFAKRRARF